MRAAMLTLRGFVKPPGPRGASYYEGRALVNRIRRFGRLGLLFVLATVDPAFCQGRSGRNSARRSKVETRNPSQDPLAAFQGTVKQIDHKRLVLEGPDADTTQFNCTKKTQYYQDTRKLDRKAVKPGDQVTVEARRAPDWTFDAVNVHIERQGSTAFAPPR
jgi:hypothetical protein